MSRFAGAEKIGRGRLILVALVLAGFSLSTFCNADAEGTLLPDRSNTVIGAKTLIDHSFQVYDAECKATAVVYFEAASPNTNYGEVQLTATIPGKGSGSCKMDASTAIRLSRALENVIARAKAAKEGDRIEYRYSLDDGTFFSARQAGDERSTSYQLGQGGLGTQTMKRVDDLLHFRNAIDKCLEELSKPVTQQMPNPDFNE